MNNQNKPNFNSSWPPYPMKNGMYMPNMDPYAMPIGVSFPLYPLYNYDNSDELDKDFCCIKDLYPSIARKIQKEIEIECDKLEYEGSCMFDEVPDKIHLGMLVDHIYLKMQELDKADPSLRTENLNPQGNPFGNNELNNSPPSSPLRYSGPQPDYQADGRPNWLHSLIEIMLYNEMYDRRRRYRRRKRWY